MEKPKGSMMFSNTEDKPRENPKHPQVNRRLQMCTGLNLMKEIYSLNLRIYLSFPSFLNWAYLTRGNHCGKRASWLPFSSLQNTFSTPTPASLLAVMLQCLKNSNHFPYFSPYCTSDGDCVVEPMSQEEVVVVPDWECWAANWARAWAVLNCSKNWEPVVLLPLASPTSPNPFPNMLTCRSTQRLEKSTAKQPCSATQKTNKQKQNTYPG